MNNAIISTQITNEDGEYLFENLNPNEYKVKFAATDSLSITYFQLGDPELDSDIEIFLSFRPESSTYQLVTISQVLMVVLQDSHPLATMCGLIKRRWYSK